MPEGRKRQNRGLARLIPFDPAMKAIKQQGAGNDHTLLKFK
ncbi:hypothetical protein [Pelagibius sp. Alg239-R121]|nr:hypothetical protein [Pelagibius sp. Alg239-R121]